MISRRCVICNKVSSNSIETNAGDFTTDVFFIDEKTGGDICYECNSWTDSVIHDYNLVDIETEELFENEEPFVLTLEIDDIVELADNDNREITRTDS